MSHNVDDSVSAAITMEEHSDSGSVKTTETASNDGGAAIDQRHPPIAKAETNRVICLKLMVLLVLFVSGAGTAVVVHRYCTRIELSRLRDHFDNDATKVLEAIGLSLEITLSAFDSFTVSIVSNAMATNSTWPFVTVPNFAVRASKILPLTKTVLVNVLPVVQPHQRVEYETYTRNNDYWVNESMTVQETWEGYYGPVIYDWDPNPVIHGFVDLPYNMSRIFLPNWQTFPSIPNEYAPYGYDWLTATDPSALIVCLETHHAVLSDTYLLPRPDDPEAEAEAQEWANFYSDYIGPNENPMEPVIDFYYPIINTIDRVNVAGSMSYDPSQHEIVGILAAPFYWRSLICGNLPSDSNGIVIVFDSPCNDPFTYQIDGPRVVYLGVGDKHDKQYDDYVKTGVLSSQHGFSNAGFQYTGAHLDEENCPVTMHLYPSDDMKAYFTTRNPTVFATGTVLIFLFASIVFFLYDYYVERRQQLVLGSATRSAAIVSSLFPSTVRDRLYPTTTERRDSLGSRLQSFLRDENEMGSVETRPAYRLVGEPIAELYPETTVLFADIVGFTAWSSAHQPVQVFHLLETLYGAFDEIAKHLGVFKVETVGDCYVAVVGLPSPRKNHAVVMARFAQACIDKMDSVTDELAASLGECTSHLTLRIGLNSGPTTAGVLRGEKARFQLFGDTVNTASRMESTGESNCIHISRETADLITNAGKGHWVTPRSDVIQAKGKGEMHTYWCNPSVQTSRG